MRGKDDCDYYCFWTEGITPAYAGKSTSQPALLPVYGDHPRLCGEK